MFITRLVDPVPYTWHFRFYLVCVCVKAAQSCLTLWDPHGLYSPWSSPGQNTAMGSLFLLQGIFPTQGSNPGLPHCRQILYQLSHKGSPRILEWVAYPFCRGPSQPRNQTGVSCNAGGFFSNWAMREAPHIWSSCERRGRWKSWWNWLHSRFQVELWCKDVSCHEQECTGSQDKLAYIFCSFYTSLCS